MTPPAPGQPALAGWDCHAHLFGPYERYPLMAERSYTPPPASEEAFAAHLDRLGMAHAVLVHPSAYGDDHTRLLDALAHRPQWRGVAVKRDATPASLRALRSQGVRALRFSQRSGAGANFAGSASFDDLLRLAPGMADAGLHAEMWTDCVTLPGLRDALAALPVPMVLDHMGGFDRHAGVGQAGFQAMLDLLGTGRLWVKLSAYRNVLDGELDDARPFHDALVAANPDRLVWGSDWPHLRIAPVPDARDLLRACQRWIGDAARVRRILVDNPAALYD